MSTTPNRERALADLADKAKFRALLEQHDGYARHLAAALGISETTIRRRAERHGVALAEPGRPQKHPTLNSRAWLLEVAEDVGYRPREFNGVEDPFSRSDRQAGSRFVSEIVARLGVSRSTALDAKAFLDGRKTKSSFRPRGASGRNA